MKWLAILLASFGAGRMPHIVVLPPWHPHHRKCHYQIGSCGCGCGSGGGGGG